MTGTGRRSRRWPGSGLLSRGLAAFQPPTYGKEGSGAGLTRHDGRALVREAGFGVLSAFAWVARYVWQCTRQVEAAGLANPSARCGRAMLADGRGAAWRGLAWPALGSLRACPVARRTCRLYISSHIGIMLHAHRMRHGSNTYYFTIAQDLVLELKIQSPS